jgi:tRNA G18 (ribose-2'-O)-methylase SpoU
MTSSGVVDIADPEDERLADFVDLADPGARRKRERDEIFIAEGFIAVRRLAESRHTVRSVLVERSKLARLGDAVDHLGVPIYVADRDVLEATVGFHMHRGIVAAADRGPLPQVADLLDGASRLAVLEGLNDPENLGLIARTARAFGIDALVLDPTCIDPYYRRSVRVSMGEILLLDVARSDDWPGDLDVIRSAGFATWAMTPAADAEDLWDVDVPERIAMIFGAEGPGLSAQAMRRADRRVRIPICRDVDSINVGHAAAVTFAATRRP